MLQLQNLKQYSEDEDKVDPNEEDEGCDCVVLRLTQEFNIQPYTINPGHLI